MCIRIVCLSVLAFVGLSAAMQPTDPVPPAFAAAAAVQSPGCRIGYSSRNHRVEAICDDKSRADAAYVLLRAAAHGKTAFEPLCTYRVPLTTPPQAISCIVTVE